MLTTAGIKNIFLRIFLGVFLQARKGPTPINANKNNIFINIYNLSNYDASILTADKQTSDYFNETIKSDPELKESSKIVVNWITSELFSLLNKNDLELSNSPVSPKNLGQLVKLISTNEISGKIAKNVLTDQAIRLKRLPPF